MDTQQPPTSDKDLQAIVSQLPVAVQEFFASGKSEIIARNLTQKYQLHIDQGAIVEREIILLLLGLKNPTEFSQAIAQEARLNQQTINGIVQDVNVQIFMPLREEMMRKPVIGAIPAPSAAPVGNAQPEKYFHLENKIPAPPKPVPPVVKPPLAAQPSTLAQAIGNALNAKPKVVQPRPPFSNSAPLPPKFASLRPAIAPSVGGPNKLLEDHEEPHIEFNKVQPPPPVNLPGAMPPVPVPPAPAAPIAPIKSYATDPYREPIDEK